MRDLRALPKAHLHLHLDGALRPSTYRELAAEAGLPAPLPTSYGSFADFGATITAAARTLRTPTEVERVVGEIVEDAAADGACWVEVSMWPGLFAGRLGSDADALDTVLAAGRRASQSAGTANGAGFGLVVAANRDRGPAEAVATARLAADRAGAGVVAFGLDGDETSAGPASFAEAFDLARAADLPATPHAGELCPAASVREAVEVLGARRVMHGVRAIDDPAVTGHLRDSGISLDVCPTSNLLLSVVPSLSEHPLPRLLDAGVRCSVNADDPLLFGTGLLQEYERCRDVLGLPDEALASIARTSVESSGAPVETKRAALAGIDAWLASPVS
jgi:adenosine deaminase